MKLNLTRADSGRIISLVHGSEAEIQLPENPTTGYMWHADPIHDGVCNVVMGDVSAPGEHAPGAGIMRIVKIQPLAAGRCLVRLRLRRSWEPLDQAIDTFEITLDCQHC
jgi:predicted secreted protein